MGPLESLGVPLVPKSLDTLVELFRFTRYVERNKVHFASKISLKSLSQTFLMFGPLVDKQQKTSEKVRNIKFSLGRYSDKCHGNLGARLTNVGFIWLLVDLG